MVTLNFCAPCGEKRIKEVKDKLEAILASSSSNIDACFICETLLLTSQSKSTENHENQSRKSLIKTNDDESFVTVSLHKTGIKTEVLEDGDVPNVGAFESVHALESVPDDREQQTSHSGHRSSLEVKGHPQEKRDVKKETSESAKGHDASNVEVAEGQDDEDLSQSSACNETHAENDAKEPQDMKHVQYTMSALQPEIAEMLDITDDPKMPYQCRKCSHKCRHIRFIIPHICYHLGRSRRNLKPYQCTKCCDKKFASLVKWTDHTKHYQCQYPSCQVIRKSKIALKKHKKTHKKILAKLVRCKVCKEKFTTYYKLTIHKQKSHRLEKNGKNASKGGKKASKGSNNASKDSKNAAKDSKSAIPIKKEKHDDSDGRSDDEVDIKKEDGKIKLSALAPELRKLLTDESHQGDGIKCKYCDKPPFIIVGNFLIHVSEHVDKDLLVDPYQCQECCDKKFKTYGEWTTHVKPFRCDVPGCKRRLPKRSNLKAHYLKAHSLRDVPCTQCPKMFRTRYALNEHVKLVHEQIKRFTCSVCAKQYYNRHTLLLHERGHRNEKPFHCECGRTFTTGHRLKIHKMDHTGEKPFVCEQCGYRTKTKENLKLHQYTHSEIKPFQCEVCGKQMTCQSWYKRHKQQHTGQGILKCRYCDERFKNPDTRERHLRTHPEWKGVKKYVCEVCGKDLIVKDKLRRHMLIHTGEKPFACSLCNFCCNRASSLKTHQKQHEKADFRDMERQKRLQDELQVIQEVQTAASWIVL